MTQPIVSSTESHVGSAASTRRERARRFSAPSASDGFSLPEVLVVVLIIGVLAAVAIAALLSTTTKAMDVQAKELARNAQTAAEVVASDHGSSYSAVTKAEIAAQDPTIAITPSEQHAYLSATSSGELEYSVTATATDGDQLTIARASDGTVSRSCFSPKLKTGCSGGERASW